MEHTENQTFIELLNFLKDQKGIPFSQVAKRIGISSDKIRSIRAGRSSANQDLIDRVHEAFPEVVRGEMEKSEEIRLLKAENEALKVVNQQLERRILELLLQKEKEQ